MFVNIVVKIRETSIRHENLWRFVPLILWICVIFYSSTGNASMAMTSGLLRPWLEMFFSSEDTIYLANVIIRKIAHLTYYALLAIFAIFAVIGSPFEWVKKNWIWSILGLVLVVASIDEFIQSFYPSRGSSVWDVMLDCVGGSIILIITKIFFSFAKNNR